MVGCYISLRHIRSAEPPSHRLRRTPAFLALCDGTSGSAAAHNFRGPRRVPLHFEGRSARASRRTYYGEYRKGTILSQLERGVMLTSPPDWPRLPSPSSRDTARLGVIVSAVLHFLRRPRANASELHSRSEECKWIYSIIEQFNHLPTAFAPAH